MEYWQEINEKFKPWVDTELDITVIDLFAGCGGLSLGFEANGFRTIGYEMNGNAAKTYNSNLLGNCFEKKLTLESNIENGDVIIGGPPCQPFSVGGKQLGLKDSRDGFPIFISAIQNINPEVFIFENVRGMLYRNKHYFDEIIQELKILGYIISYEILNASDYEVPQNRERVVVMGSKIGIEHPDKIGRKITAGQALGELAFQFSENSKFFTKEMDKYVAKYEKASRCANPRDLNLERVARTLTCRNLAGATGDMHRIKLEDGRRRRISVREAARLQSFPDWFEFIGSETDQYNQIGNAVAPYFSYHIASKVKLYFESKKFEKASSIKKTVSNNA